MRLPRKGILIRLCIYVPLLAYFGWAAYQRYRTEQAEQSAPVQFEGDKKVVPLGDGRTIEVYEISEDQARQMGIEPQRDREAAPAPEAPANPPANPPAAAPPGAN